MPYIRQDKREPIDESLKISLNNAWYHNAGSLNYLITRLFHRHIVQRGLKYEVINELIGVLECCKLELYRMIAAKYEDKKRLENGPVSELDAKSLEDVR